MRAMLKHGTNALQTHDDIASLHNYSATEMNAVGEEIETSEHVSGLVSMDRVVDHIYSANLIVIIQPTSFLKHFQK